MSQGPNPRPDSSRPIERGAAPLSSKAANLRRLQAAGFRVPPFVVIPTDLFERFLAVLDSPPTAQRMLGAPMPGSLSRKIFQAVQELPDSESPLAVRSSMAGEDSVRYSFAGQLDSILNVCGPEAVVTAVKVCWASAYGDRATAYRKQHGLLHDKVAMEVIVQEMVPAEVSGVIFTADPAARDPRWIVISATEGLGEALVQGHVEGETYRVNRESGEIVGESRVLDRAQITAFASIATKIEALFERPQDIEFALAGGELFILQARPITTPIFTERILWDNSNITESYSGVTMPLTFSAIRNAYAQVYRQFLGLMGVQRVDEYVLRTLLGFYDGRVYYQLLNWYRALALLPAFEHNRRFMEQMMGVKQPSGEEVRPGTGGHLVLMAWLLRMVHLHVTSERRVQEFLKRFNTVLAEYRALDLAAMTPHELCAAYRDLEARLLGNWQAPILTDFFAMIFFGMLRRLSERWLDPDGSLHNDLLVGDGAIESLEPARQIQALGGQVRENPHLRSIFSLPDPSETLTLLRRGPEFSGFQAALDDYLRRYGDRCMNELKLEEPNLRDNPVRLIRLIRSAMEHPVELADPSSLRAKAETRLAGLKFLRRGLFGWVLKHARRHVRNRENMRFARTRLFGLLRRLFNALGKQWAEAGILGHRDNIYYLTVSEIWDFIEGTAMTLNLQGLAALRREEYTTHERRVLPDRFETFGVPYLDSPRDLLARAETDEDGLRGVGCCSGHVKGRARVVRSVEEINDLGGDILVAEGTDPGWVFLFPSASGILVERGSPLSHSAIVARELGKPTIVNLPGLTARIHTGDEVEMDGGKGLVWIRRA